MSYRRHYESLLSREPRDRRCLDIGDDPRLREDYYPSEDEVQDRIDRQWQRADEDRDR